MCEQRNSQLYTYCSIGLFKFLLVENVGVHSKYTCNSRSVFRRTCSEIILYHLISFLFFLSPSTIFDTKKDGHIQLLLLGCARLFR